MPRKKNNIIIVEDTIIKDKKIPNDTVTNTENATVESISDIIEISQLKGKEIWHYSMLEKFFTNCDKEQIKQMVDIIEGNHLISLRFLDWYVTRYCNLYKTTINILNKFCTQNNFNINISYKAQLKSFTKKYFDPFKRKKKFFFFFDHYDLNFLTTLGQLNFFRWAMTHDIITHAETNYTSIILKYDHVNSFFKKHTIDSESQELTDTTLNSKSESTSITTNTEMSESVKKLIYEDKTKKKNVFNIPTITRNIYLEL